MASSKLIPKSKTFGGKRLYSYNGYKTKQGAENNCKRIRDAGYPAQWTKCGKIFVVFTSKSLANS